MPYFPLNSQQKFVLVEEAAAALSQLSANQFSTFQNITEELIGADEKIDLLEWSLRKVIDHDFGRQHSPRGPLHGRVSIRNRIPECSIILGALAHYGQEEADPKPAFEAGLRALDRSQAIELPPIEDCGLRGLDSAMARLSKLSPMAKRTLLDACARTIDHDKKTTDVEIQIPARLGRFHFLSAWPRRSPTLQHNQRGKRSPKQAKLPGAHFPLRIGTPCLPFTKRQDLDSGFWIPWSRNQAEEETSEEDFLTRLIK